MKKLVVAMILFPALIVAALYGVVLYRGPRMTVQPHIRTFQAVLPPVPQGTVTVQQFPALPTAAQAAPLHNPLERTEANLEQGRVYYHYYCVFCHGESGAGNGPVGQSYQPVPADLRSAKMRQYSDGELLRAMLTGIGHEPVLEKVVAVRHRWALVLFVRSLSSSS